MTASRAAALAILALLLVLYAALMLAAGNAVRDLAIARVTHAPAPPPPAPPELGADVALVAPTATAAARALAATLRREAARGGVLIEALDPIGIDDRSVALTLAASGREPALLGFVNRIERARPAIRLASWRITPAPGGSLRLQAAAVAGWAPR